MIYPHSGIATSAVFICPAVAVGLLTACGSVAEDINELLLFPGVKISFSADNMAYVECR